MKTFTECKDEVTNIRNKIKSDLVDNSIIPKDLRMVVMQLDILDILFLQDDYEEQYKTMTPLDEFFEQCYEYIEFYKGEHYEKTRITTDD